MKRGAAKEWEPVVTPTDPCVSARGVLEERQRNRPSELETRGYVEATQFLKDGTQAPQRAVANQDCEKIAPAKLNRMILQERAKTERDRAVAPFPQDNARPIFLNRVQRDLEGKEKLRDVKDTRQTASSTTNTAP